MEEVLHKDRLSKITKGNFTSVRKVLHQFSQRKQLK